MVRRDTDKQYGTIVVAEPFATADRAGYEIKYQRYDGTYGAMTVPSRIPAPHVGDRIKLPQQ